jgi:hypothetical protein
VRILKTESIKKKIPDQKTAPNAVCHVTPITITAVYVKNALRPMPGATMIGFFAYAPINNELKKQTNTVAVNTPLNGMPVLLSIDGFTTII